MSKQENRPVVFPLMNNIPGVDSQMSSSLSTGPVVRKDGGNNFLSILKSMDKNHSIKKRGDGIVSGNIQR